MKFRKGKKKGWGRNTHARSVEVKNIYILRYGRKQIEAYVSGTYQKKFGVLHKQPAYRGTLVRPYVTPCSPLWKYFVYKKRMQFCLLFLEDIFFSVFQVLQFEKLIRTRSLIRQGSNMSEVNEIFSSVRFLLKQNQMVICFLSV